MMPIPEAVSLGVAVGTAAAAVIAGPLLVRARRAAARLRDERDAAVGESRALTERQRVWEAELEHLAAERLPAVLQGKRTTPGLRHGELAGSVFEVWQRALLERTAGAVTGVRTREESARAAFLVMADRIQVMALAQQQGLDVLEQTAEDPVLMAGLMRADHAAAQLARQAQTMKVLCGAWPGRQWPDAVPLLDVVRGAQSRILEYQRVRVQGARDTAVEPRAVEALIHAVAELLDNATRYSPPTVSVLVAIRPVHSGAVIEIDDGGLGMTEQALAEAGLRLAGGEAARGRGWGPNPQLGLSAVGQLARRYGFSVKLDSPSAYGGVRAVVLVPSALLTASRTVGPPAVPAPAPEAPVAPAAQRAPEHPRPGTTPDPAAPGALPRRRNRRATTATGPEQPRPEAAPGPAPDGLPRRRNRRPSTAGGPEEPSRAASAPLPRRRSRRPAAGTGGPGSALSAPGAAALPGDSGTAPGRATRPPAAPADRPALSPQQAADFMSSLQTGTRIGREEAAGEARGEARTADAAPPVNDTERETR
ncbi:hypothetical protein I5Q34_13675 [Streptomyces sp. AV19]|uniref:ATP-binding protein n=1 Tax=Streptomyces sp. AV19 TaxID=2793068 RepID=UPI0018FE9C48|nr:ATP-binding protein [Streptomyces sp. AV19]MBH1935309.1 hypothetical protein [Streptomyces sp. AV19]MDG4531194.1 hypothetical protein [Streptomyces sp. AV19]